MEVCTTICISLDLSSFIVIVVIVSSACVIGNIDPTYANALTIRVPLGSLRHLGTTYIHKYVYRLPMRQKTSTGTHVIPSNQHQHKRWSLVVDALHYSVNPSDYNGNSQQWWVLVISLYRSWLENHGIPRNCNPLVWHYRRISLCSRDIRITTIRNHTIFGSIDFYKVCWLDIVVVYLVRSLWVNLARF